MDDEPTKKPADVEEQKRMGIGLALGIPFGVLLSLLLDNWGMIGVGVALGLVFGAVPWKSSGPTEGGERTDHGPRGDD